MVETIGEAGQWGVPPAGRAGLVVGEGEEVGVHGLQGVGWISPRETRFTQSMIQETRWDWGNCDCVRVRSKVNSLPKVSSLGKIEVFTNSTLERYIFTCSKN